MTGLDAAYRFFKMFGPNHVFHRLPVHYKKYLIQTFEKPSPVHYIPEPKEWIKDPKTGERKRIVDIPIPLQLPKEVDEGLWGGEGVIKGFRKKDGPRLPRWWTPRLTKVVVYSEILDKYMNVVVTERTVCLIDEAFGFDNYILKTPVQDLRSMLGLKLRRQMLLSLIHKNSYPNDPKKQEEIVEKYKEFIRPEEEVEWIGLTLAEALAKQKAIEAAQISSQKPLKNKYRKELIQNLQEMKSKDATEEEIDTMKKSSSWITRWNPFSKSTGSQDQRRE